MSVTALIPVYDSAAYLRAALWSAVAQKMVAAQVIVVDDGSTDEGAILLDGLSSGLPTVRVIHQPNAGQGAARNRGLERATGEYVYFMDADDALAEPDALARLAEVMDRDRLDVLFFDAVTKVDAGVEVPDAVVRASDYIRKHDYCGVYTGASCFPSS